MRKKGSMELSVNSIVILVIAVVMMGLILGFIRSKFTDIGGGFLVDENPAPEATASDPITMSRINVPVSGVKKMGLNINFYYTGSGSIQNAEPLFECNTPTVKIDGEYYGKEALASSNTDYTGNIKLSASQPKDTYLCKVCFLSSYITAPNANKPCTTLAAGVNVVAEKEFQLIVQ